MTSSPSTRKRSRADANGRPHAETPSPSAEWKQKLRRAALAWFKKNARDLPWRRSCDPYRVWISEIMLQQTQVETVRAYFERFTAAFPEVQQLAAADEEQVLRLWEGLGYYRRARQLHAAAQEIVARHDGRLPEDPAQLQALPGVGRYTAGAILSIAHDQPRPIVEANTIRLYSRILGYAGDPTSTVGQAWLWRTAEEILPRRRAGQFNQAMMEIGAEVCKPREPRCGECPLAALCTARLEGLVEKIPPPKPRAAPTSLHEAAIVLRKGGKILMHRYGEGRRWAGLWDFVRFGLDAKTDVARRREIIERVRETTGLEVALGAKFAALKHGVTRYRITLDCFKAEYISGRLRKGSQGGQWKWATLRRIESLPLSTTGREIARKIGCRP